MKKITKERITEIKIERSKFIGYLAPVNSVEEAKEYISKISKDNYDATHNCWAYIVGYKGDKFHYSDDGEPSGSAGKPIYGMLRKYELSFVVAVVTRYYGGKKLGVRGLIDAYGGSIENSLKKKPLKRLVKIEKINIQTHYSFFDKLAYEIDAFKGKITDKQFTDKIVIEVSIEENDKPKLMEYLKNIQKINKIKILGD